MLIGDIVQYCSDPALGSFLTIIKRIFNMLEIITPVILMIGLAVPFFKIIVIDHNKVSREDESKTQYEIEKTHIYNALTAAVIVMMLPIIVNVVMYALSFGTNDRFVVSECWNDAKVTQGKAQYITYDSKKKKYNFLINPDEYVGVDTDPNFRSDRVPVDDDDDEYDSDEFQSYGNIVWDPNDVTKISNLNAAQLTQILNKHSSSAKNFIPYAQALINAEKKHHVNVFFLIGIDALESGWITSPISKACNNLGGVTESKSHPSNGCGSNPGHKFAYFSSVGEYIDYHANLLHKSYLTKGAPYYHGTSIKAVQTNYCPLSDGCGDWAPSVKKIANSLYSQVSKLNIGGASGVAEKIAKAAEYYAWPAGTSKSKYCRFNGGGATSHFMTDYRKYWPNFKNSSDKSVAAGTCCCHFARTCVVKGLGKKFSFTLLPGSSKDEYTKNKMANLGFTRIKFDGNKSSLKRGDVLYYRNKGSGGHVWIYLGNGKAAEAAHGSGYGGRITTVSKSKLKTSTKSVYYIFRANR